MFPVFLRSKSENKTVLFLLWIGKACVCCISLK
jgi:hypothetical protein